MFVRIYLVIACLVGFLESIEGLQFILKLAKGSVLNTALSVVELIWLLVSLMALVFFHLAKVSKLSPISFVAYYFLAFLLAFIFAALDSNIAKQFVAQEMPTYAAWIGFLFGAYFFVVNFMLIRSMKFETKKD